MMAGSDARISIERGEILYFVSDNVLLVSRKCRAGMSMQSTIAICCSEIKQVKLMSVAIWKRAMDSCADSVKMEMLYLRSDNVLWVNLKGADNDGLFIGSETSSRPRVCEGHGASTLI